MRVFVVIAVVFVLFATADEDTHEYKQGDTVHVWANKIGPFDNPQETYQYYTLPFCPPEDTIEHPPDGLGEVLEGNKLLKSRVHVEYNVSMESVKHCVIDMDERRSAIFQEAVRQNYWYQFIVDDLPMWAMLGALFLPQSAPENAEPIPYIYTHQRFDFGVNQGRFIEANLTSGSPVPIVSGESVTMTYSVYWHETDHDFAYRYNRYLDFNFFEHQVHWFSIINSFMMVFFLTGLVAIILLRTLKNDFAKYSMQDDLNDLDSSLIDESGWKQVSADVFRAPAHLELFCAIVGTGAQLVVLVFFMILYAIASTWEIGRGRFFSSGIAMYALTSVASGYFGGGLYSRCGGRKWIRTMVLTASLLPGVVFVTIIALDTIATMYQSLAAIPMSSIFTVMMIWMLISFPLTLAGTIIGRNWAGKQNIPCRVNVIPREIPEKPWYLNFLVVCMLTGILPFGSIFIEMYFIFNSFWLYKFYYVYGFMLLVFIILVMVTLCVTVVTTYFMLNAEEYRWQWLSVLSSGSTAVYVFIYAIYFFLSKTMMSGFFQTAFYFGYMGLLCLALGILCGTVGFIGASRFVHAIYSSIKSD